MAFAFTIIWKLSCAISLSCTFGMGTYDLIGSIYRCDASVLTDGVSNDNVTAVYGAHQTGKSHTNVLGLKIYNRNLQYVPINVEKFFPNIKVLYFESNSISHISNRHLIPFPNLEYLSLHTNRITSLDSNVLSGLNSLKYVTFSFNNIINIGHDFILPNAGRVFFNKNTCISTEATTAAQITALRFTILVSCPPTITQIENTLESRPNLLTNVNDQVQNLFNRTHYIEESHAEMDNKVESLDTDLQQINLQLTNEITDLKQRNLQLETRVTFLEAVIEGKLGLKMGNEN